MAGSSPAMTPWLGTFGATHYRIGVTYIAHETTRGIPETGCARDTQCRDANLSAVMAGLDPAIQTTVSEQRRVEVVPLGVHGIDQRGFPRAPPVLHGVLALDGRPDRVVDLKPDEIVELVARGEAADDLVLVLPYALRQVGGDADIDRAIAAAGHDVDETAHAG